ncbi:hypothetical protein GCM10010306_099590 [Streptomyces umbrinus]|nr:hypothetical protein GCM10010306_099590 [Streptomyces umbrinus]
MPRRYCERVHKRHAPEGTGALTDEEARWPQDSSAGALGASDGPVTGYRCDTGPRR